MYKKKRITCKVLTESGKEKTLSFRCEPDIETIERYLKMYKVVKYKLYRINEIRFSNTIEWEELKK